ncbi:hypothetical protein [Dactylosporangium sp. NPDC049140]|uniref:hypothetical protein n=1 Tax=Dactylosporangium sp. NPDC049140 TaxID=3155647 RepID=UPI00340D212D
MSKELIIGVISSMLATALVVLTAAAYRRYATPMNTLRRRIRLARQMDEAGLLFFFASRSDYQRFRVTPTTATYFRLAKRRIEMVAHSLAYGQLSQGIAGELASILEENPSLEIVLSTLSPRSAHVRPLAQYLKGAPSGDESHGDELERRLRSDLIETLTALHAAREAMPSAARFRFTIKVYDTLPVASVIMLDRGSSTGRTQVDLKLFGSPLHKSISFEIGNGSALYNAATTAWGTLLDGAEIFDPARHLAS